MIAQAVEKTHIVVHGNEPALIVGLFVGALLFTVILFWCWDADKSEWNQNIVEALDQLDQRDAPK